MIAVRYQSHELRIDLFVGHHADDLVAVPRLPDLVRDSKLETRIRPDTTYTIHIYNESGRTPQERTIVREGRDFSELVISI